MAQVRNEDEYILEAMDEVTPKECRICKGKDKLSIFWNDSLEKKSEKNFYICEECNGIIKGIYIDILLENEEKTGKTIESQLNELNKKIISLKELRQKNR
ncbi:hypothetical protein [Clostridium saccharoperbutylacetonicum]